MNDASTARGISLLLLSTLLFASQDAITYHLTQTLPVAQIAVVRYFFFFLFAVVYAMRRGGLLRTLHAKRPGLQILRGLLISSELMIFAFAISKLGLAEVHAIFACSPLLVTALSAPLLGEAIGWRRWLAVFLGFIGTLIILRPSGDVFQSAALVAMLGSLLWALYQITTRRAARTDSFATALLYVGMVGLLWTGILAGWVWRMPVGAEIFWLLALSISSVIAHMLLIKSLELAPAVVLQPFHYFILVWALCLSWILYGQVLSALTFLGATIVVGSGLFIVYREYRLSKN